jgi:hypothetical protein
MIEIIFILLLSHGINYKYIYMKWHFQKYGTYIYRYLHSDTYA